MGTPATAPRATSVIEASPAALASGPREPRGSSGVSSSWMRSSSRAALGDLAGPDRLVQREDGVHQGLGARRAARRVDVDGDDLVDALDDGVVVEHAAGRGADAHRDDPLGLHHLVVDLAEHRRHLLADPAGHDHQVGLARRVPEDLHAEAREVVVGGARRHHLDRAAGQAEGGRPHARRARAHLTRSSTRAGEEVVLEILEAHRSISRYAARPAAGSAVILAMVDSEVRAGMPAVRRLTGPQLSAPLLTRKSSETKTTTEKVTTSTRPKLPELAEDHGEGVEEDDLDVEDDEDHRHQVEANGEAHAAARSRGRCRTRRARAWRPSASCGARGARRPTNEPAANKMPKTSRNRTGRYWSTCLISSMRTRSQAHRTAASGPPPAGSYDDGP